MATDDVWDIFQMGGNFPKYINSIEPMDSYIEAGTIDVSDTTENFLATTRATTALRWESPLEPTLTESLTIRPCFRSRTGRAV